MLNNCSQINSFDQFLISHFNLENVASSATLIQNNASKKIKKCKSIIKKSVTSKKEDKILSNDKISAEIKSEFADLSAVLDSIPDKVRAMNIQDLAHKHESEWYHAFRDLKEEISHEINQHHPHHLGTLKKKSDIKEFTEVLDEHIEKVVLELERIFQAFPNMARVAVIYLVSIIIAIPLVFFSFNTNKNISYNSPEKNLRQGHSRFIEISEEMKSDYIARNSARIISSGKSIVDANDILPISKVAGAYEEKDQSTHKVPSWYRYISNIKDELGNFFVK